jgi:branched-chain amino acid transport system substrate-binding protein
MKLEGSVSRREFLKLAGMAGAAVGATGAFGALVSACGGESTTTTVVSAATSSTSAPATTVSSVTASSAAGETTTVSAAAEAGREIKIGWVSPQTGALASFGIPDKYCMDRWNEATKDGLVCGDGKKHPISILLRDTQSDSNRAGQVAGDLINNDSVDLMMVASAPENTNPVADQCEANGTPCISSQTPWQAFFFGRNGDPKVGFKWTYHVFVGLEDLVAIYTGMWDAVSTNKQVGAMWPNDSDGNVFRPNFTAALKQQNFTVVDTGAFQDGMEDFTSQISALKKGGCEILTGVLEPSDFTNFWKQAYQQAYRPKVATIAKALLFPQSINAVGDIGIGITSEVAWHPTFPFKSSLTGETCQQLAADFEQKTGNQWTIPLLHYLVFEMAVDALKRATSVDDKSAIIDAVKTIKMDTIEGPIDFTLPVKDGTVRPVPNVYKPPICLGQWVKGSDIGSKWPYDLVLVNNAAAPMIPVQAAPKLLGQ